jgi:riboflavin kinase / FMN adenylyltransferase
VKVYFGINEFKKVNKPVITTGTFDGVHNGHKKIIKNLISKAKEIEGESVMITFNPHPRLVLFPENNNLKLLNSLEEKISLLEKEGLDHLIIQPFTIEFSRLSALEYIRDLLVNKLGLHTLVIGYDHHFGRNREGSFEELQEFAQLYNFDIEQISALDIESVNVSSTKIRNALADGNVALANTFLGYNFGFTGNVVKGDGIGKTIGYPTANIELTDKYKTIPANGVYACLVNLEDQAFKGMLNIGVRPTINDQKHQKIEINLLGFNGNLYDKTLTIELIEKLRDEQKFDSLEELKSQLGIDKENALKVLQP